MKRKEIQADIEDEEIDSDDDNPFPFALECVPFESLQQNIVLLPKSPSRPPKTITAEMQYTILHKLRVDQEAGQQCRVENFEQKTDEWLAARQYRITGSRVGSIMSHNFFQKRSDLLKDMLWGGFKGNEATEWGSTHEDVACRKYIEFLQKKLKTKNVTIAHTGLRVMKSNPIFGVSPDGIVSVDGKPFLLLEIKCPFSQRNKRLSPNRYIYSSYFDQINLVMYVFGETIPDFKQCDFFTWTPAESKLERLWYAKDYTEKEMAPECEEWYYRRALPLFAAKEFGMLKKGSTALGAGVTVEPVRTIKSIIVESLPK